jgi:hypothetical protein
MRTRALSLIEVVASLVLLATTITALLLAQSQSLRQVRDIQEQETADVLAGEIMATWRIEERQHSDVEDGVFDGRPQWRWERRSQPYPLSHDLALREVVLEVWHHDGIGDRLVRELTWLERPYEPSPPVVR